MNFSTVKKLLVLVSVMLSCTLIASIAKADNVPIDVDVLNVGDFSPDPVYINKESWGMATVRPNEGEYNIELFLQLPSVDIDPEWSVGAQYERFLGDWWHDDGEDGANSNASLAPEDALGLYQWVRVEPDSPAYWHVEPSCTLWFYGPDPNVAGVSHWYYGYDYVIMDVTAISFELWSDYAVLIPQNVGDQSIWHFVTPKQGTETWVAIHAQVYPEDFEVAGGDISWDGDGMTDTGDPTTYWTAFSVPDYADAYLYWQSQYVEHARVWSVWATIGATPNAAINDNFGGTGRRIGLGYDFIHTIEPAALFTATDRPDLSGANTVPVPPSGGTNYAGSLLTGGADHLWDNSRQIRQKFVNPNGLVPSGAASFSTTFPNFPSAADGDGHSGTAVDAALVPVIGNDDAGTGDETNDPYAGGGAGTLTGTDGPTRVMTNNIGANGNTVEWRLQFIEFTRVQLGNSWYRISDDFLWRVDLKMQKAGGVWIDNGSTQALDNAGF